jgi:alpha-amylase
MGVMLQAFYWDCPINDSKEFQWWEFVSEKIRSISNAGFSSIWLPPVHKAAKSTSMGYDPYDYYDLGDYNQKGNTKTWFGNQKELTDLINKAHHFNMHVIADIVINHNSGGELEYNKFSNEYSWTLFKPLSGRFNRNYECFHPCEYEEKDNAVFGNMPDLCHLNPYVYEQIIKLMRYLIEEIGFDGFRYDFVKGYGTSILTRIQEYNYTKNNNIYKIFGVGEQWDCVSNIDEWLNKVNCCNDSKVSAMDFPTQNTLKKLCDCYGFDLNGLNPDKMLFKKYPFNTVTFVDNHDTDKDKSKAIINDKMLAYGYILTHEGYPCVFWKDYYNYNLGKEISQLVHVHEKYAAGDTQVLYIDHDFYIMQRLGFGNQPGLIFALNNGDRWNNAWVSTKWGNVHLKPVAWWSRNSSHKPTKQFAWKDGQAQIWAPPRGYVVYVQN